MELAKAGDIDGIYEVFSQTVKEDIRIFKHLYLSHRTGY